MSTVEHLVSTVEHLVRMLELSEVILDMVRGTVGYIQLQLVDTLVDCVTIHIPPEE